jgi:hypothetical protein
MVSSDRNFIAMKVFYVFIYLSVYSLLHSAVSGLCCNCQFIGLLVVQHVVGRTFVVVSWCLSELTRKTCSPTFKIAVSRLRLKQEQNNLCDYSHQTFAVCSVPAANQHNWVLQGCSLSKEH